MYKTVYGTIFQEKENTNQLTDVLRMKKQMQSYQWNEMLEDGMSIGNLKVLYICQIRIYADKEIYGQINSRKYHKYLRKQCKGN